MSENFPTNKISEKGIICAYPFSWMYFNLDGSVWSCNCPKRSKYMIGNIKANTIAELWNNDTARLIRRKMYAGEWQDICKPTCPVIIEYLRFNKFVKYEELENLGFLSPEVIKEIREKKDYLTAPPSLFQPDISPVCNLNCIMCSVRKSRVDADLIKKVWSDLNHYLPTATSLQLTGYGEPLASPDTRKLLMTYKGPAAFHMVTNGLLLPKYWEQIKHQKFASLNISIDAASKETYEKIRRGGRWEDLLKTLELVKQNRDKFGYIMLNMTIMRSNYKEIPQFIDLAESCGLAACFHRVHGEWGDENIFGRNDTAALAELTDIVINESIKERDIFIHFEGSCWSPYLNLKKLENSQIIKLINSLQLRNSKLNHIKKDLDNLKNELRKNDIELEFQIQEKDCQIGELENILQENKDNFENILQDKEFQIQGLKFQIEQSILMQMASRYHRIMEKVLSPNTRHRHYYELCLTGIRIIFNEGWRNFFRKTRYWLTRRSTKPKS